MSTLHNFNSSNNKVLASELEIFLKNNPWSLFLPCLYSELESEALKNIFRVE